MVHTFVWLDIIIPTCVRYDPSFDKWGWELILFLNADGVVARAAEGSVNRNAIKLKP